MTLYEQLTRYEPVNEQERQDKRAMLEFIDRNQDVLDRSNLAGHMTSSAIVVNETMDKVLFAHHNIYNSWGWVGGHNDGEPDCLKVAIKETMEETGVKAVRPYNDEILGIDIIHVSNHIKHGAFVNDHLHFNVTYLLIADESDELEINHAEHSNVRWFPLDSVLDHVTEDRMRPVYTKLFERVRRIRESKS